MKKEQYDVFISYRREGGYDIAKHLCDLLIHDKYKVSFDIDTLRSGDFDIQLLTKVEQCKDFILIVDLHAFDKTLDPNFDPDKDWLRCELAHALKHEKNIIPVFMSGVTGFPDSLPPDIEKVTKKNGPEYNRYYFDDFYRRLKTRFLHKPQKKKRILALYWSMSLILVIFILLGIINRIQAEEIERNRIIKIEEQAEEIKRLNNIIKTNQLEEGSFKNSDIVSIE